MRGVDGWQHSSEDTAAAKEQDENPWVGREGRAERTRVSVWAERTRVTPCGHRRTRVTPCGQNEPHSETSGCGVLACFLGQVNGQNMRLQPHRVHWEEASLKNGVKDGDFVCGMPHLRNFWLTRAGMSIWHAVHSRQGAPARERDLIIVCK